MSPRRVQRRAADEPGKPRRARRKGAAPAAAQEESEARLGPPQTQEWPDGDWIVRQVPGAAATKMYRCPGCDQELRPGTAHVVVWPADAAGAEGRRHWHNACWQRRPRRPGPRLQR
ncbi:MAG TPA: ATP/GTP-binding protein [Streptosporangiaceae bacterium]|nr:ATP/GTP-binding protein [Streptosporangiaceae bacterium]